MTSATTLFCRKAAVISSFVALLLICCALPASAQDIAWPTAAQDAPHGYEQIMFGLLTGVLITAATYLFFIWLAIRDRSQIYLIIILLSLATNLALSNGVVLMNFGIQTAGGIKFFQQTTMLAFLASSCFFTLNFLEIEIFNFTLASILKLAAAALAAVFILMSFNAYYVSNIMPVISLAVYAICLLAGIAASLNNVAGSRTHIMAFAILALGGMAAPLADQGIIDRHVFGLSTFFFASALSALVFAIGIAGQFSRRQEEKERQLTISNERFALAALGSNEGLFDWNMEERHIFFSDRMKKILSRDLDSTPEGVKQWMDAIVPDQRAEVQKTLSDFMAGDAVTIGFEYKITRPDGQIHWLYSSGVALRDTKTGKVRRLVGSTGDISERKKAEMGLKDSEARFRSITEAHPMPVAILTLTNSMMLYASPGVETLLGVPLTELVGYKADSYFTDQSAYQQMLADILGAHDVDGRELMMRNGKGEELPVACSARLIEFQGQHAAVIGLMDLTDRKMAEVEIANQRQALEQNEKLAALGSLLAGVAHELNNPLSVVVGQSSLLLESSSDPKTQNRADKIKKAAERCTRIVRNFLALARRKDPERKEVDLNQVINTALELIGAQLRNDEVDLALKLDEDIPLVSADSDQLNQILTNLILNAKQALQERPQPRLITVSTRYKDGNVVLKVSDNGTGVPPEIRARIFEPFFTTKKEGSGTGIGLSLSLGLAEAHGGKITYEDTPGGGATFVFALPASKTKPEAPAALPTPAAVAMAKLSSRHILLLDDEPDVMQVLADLLAMDGHTTDQCENGEVALKALEKNNYDLIISDLRMPVMDGPTFYRTLLEKFPGYKERIIFVTGDTLSPHVRSFLEEYPVIVIDKPYMPEDVRQAVARLLRIAEGRKKA